MHRDYSDDSDDEPLSAPRAQQPLPQQEKLKAATKAEGKPQVQQGRASSSRGEGREEGAEGAAHTANGHDEREEEQQQRHLAQAGTAVEAGSSTRGPNRNVNYKIKFQKARDRYGRAQAESSLLLKGLHDAQSKERKLEEELNWLLDAIAARRPDLAQLKE